MPELRRPGDAGGFSRQPLALTEGGDAQRLERLRREDPIALQDAVNTSRSFVEAVKEQDLEELRSIVANAVEGEFIEAFVLQAMVLALKSASLEIVRELIAWGVPLGHEQLNQALHLVVEITDRENFGNAWRILQLLIDGDGETKIDVNTPRVQDGWTPLCIACADACLPMAFKLLELQADPNVITRSNLTPLGLARQRREGDNEEQQEARGIIANMLRSHGAQQCWQDALAFQKRGGKQPQKKGTEEKVAAEDGSKTEVVKQTVSQTRTRFSA